MYYTQIPSIDAATAADENRVNFDLLSCCQVSHLQRVNIENLCVFVRVKYLTVRSKIKFEEQNKERFSVRISLSCVKCVFFVAGQVLGEIIYDNISLILIDRSVVMESYQMGNPLLVIIVNQMIKK